VTALHPFDGIRVVELASEHAAYAGRVLVALGAEVVLVEPPGGHHTRRYEPFVDDEPDLNSSIWWWHYNVGKSGLVLDLDRGDGAAEFRRLVAGADIVLEAEPPDRLAGLALDYDDLRQDNPALVWASVTPFGRGSSRRSDAVTDLTLLAGAGLVWSCGYDDHELPPVRGGGNQSLHVAGIYAALGALTALEHSRRTGRGQLVDVSAHAALNVTTESATYDWLVARRTVQRQTGRHAWAEPTDGTQVRAADQRYVNTGLPAKTDETCRRLLDWIDELGLRSAVPDVFFLELGVARGSQWTDVPQPDVEGDEIFRTERAALTAIAEHLPAHDFFVGAQQRGIPVGVVNAPDEVLDDPHFVARGAIVEQYHPAARQPYRVPGRPVVFDTDRRWPGPAPSLEISPPQSGQ
jgi:crotonobetainyl-CoA:carnitine CoA-transferase CaiB-like acyl-CoA transferase